MEVSFSMSQLIDKVRNFRSVGCEYNSLETNTKIRKQCEHYCVNFASLGIALEFITNRLVVYPQSVL